VNDAGSPSKIVKIRMYASIVLIAAGAIAASGSGTTVRGGAESTKTAHKLAAAANYYKPSEASLFAKSNVGGPRSATPDWALLANLTGLPTALAAQSGAAAQFGQNESMGKSRGGVVSACGQAGGTADEQIDAAITSLGESGGVVDLSCFGGTTQTLAATIHVPAYVWLRGNGRITKFQPASGSFTPLFSIDTSTSRVSGIWVDTANLAANTFNGCVFGLSGNYQPLASASSDPMQETIEDFTVTAWNQSTGAAVCFTATDSILNSIAGVSVRHGYISGTQNALNFQESGSGWINGNQISDVYIKQGAEPGECGILLHATGTTPGGIDLNTFSQMTHDDITASSGVSAVCVMGGGFIQANTWEGAIADSPVPVHYDCSPSCGDSTEYQGNTFSGAINGFWEAGAPVYDNHFGLWNRQYSFGGALNVNSLNIVKAGGLQYQGNPVFGADGSTSISLFPLAHGGAVVDSDPEGGYAPHDSDSYRVHGNVVIPSFLTGFQGSGTAVSIANGPFTPGNLRMTDGGGSDADSGLSRSSIPSQSSTAPLVNGIACIKSAGPPIVIGYCTTPPTESATPLRHPLGGTAPTCTCQ
jgi:hypothetical protein